MSYANIAALMIDGEFIQRLNACCVEQALIYKDDARPEFVRLATDVLMSGASGAFIPFVSGLPGFGDVQSQADITDAQILTGVQTVWPTVAEMRDGTPPSE